MPFALASTVSNRQYARCRIERERSEPKGRRVRPRPMNRFLGVGFPVVLVSLLIAGCGSQQAVGQGGASHPTTPAPQQVVAHASPTTTGGTCSGVAIDVAPGVKGDASPQAAIDTFLRSGSTSLTLPPTGWVSTSSGQYTSGTAVIEMNRLPDGGYVVTGARTC